MTPIQQLMLGVGGAKKTYLEDVFSTYVYKGNGGAITINSGINLSDEGGLVWTKARDLNDHNTLTDTVRGVNKELLSNDSEDEFIRTSANQTFTTTGHTWNSDNGQFNEDGKKYAAFTFRRASGFFDAVSYTGNGTSGRTFSHELASQPGMVLIKNRDEDDSWVVYHKSLGATKMLTLNSDYGSQANANLSWADTEPTSTSITVGNGGRNNTDGESYIAYIFAGGESTAATARSVEFDGTTDFLSLSSSTDFAMGTGDFTAECWIYPTDFSHAEGGYSQRIFDSNGGQLGIYLTSDGTGYVGSLVSGTDDNSSIAPNINAWNHVAISRSGTTLKAFLNGIEIDSNTSSGSVASSGDFVIGAKQSGQGGFKGKIANFRVVKGTAVYTSSFRPPTEPLTNITNTKLLCCNDSSVTGSTVTPGTITSNGDPTASTDSPFDDPAAFTFGDSKEGIIKTGSYAGNGSSTGPEVYLGWEPQWILIKRDGTESWYIWDVMRGIVTGGNDEYINANLRDPADDNPEAGNYLDLTSTGFKIVTTANAANTDGSNYIYMAIRRPDGYVGKPAELGTGVFAMDTGAGSSTVPNFDSGFPVDFATMKKTTDTSNWNTSARLMAGKFIKTNENSAEAVMSNAAWDSNVGWDKNSNYDSNWQAFMWKRHAGFDMVTYKGSNSAGNNIPHNLGRAPEMIWIKDRDQAFDWLVGHNGLNGGSSPWNYGIKLNSNGTEWQHASLWSNTAPTSTHFTLGANADCNFTDNYIAMLFASVNGISKVGYYDGSNSSQTITTGFQPRFIIIKRTETSSGWIVLDTVRGWSSGDDEYLRLDNSAEQDAAIDWGAPTSTGFTLEGDLPGSNRSGGKFIYYAHA